MKRSSYFISARSASADLHASEIILAIHDLFPKVESHGILGEWSGRTRANKIAGFDLDRCLKLGLHDKKSMSQEALAARQWLFEHLDPLEFDLALLVGYSYLHHDLAAYFKARSIPVVLYEVTPVNALSELDFSSVAARVQVALGITPGASEFVQKTGIPFHYVGSPQKDRVDRVKLDARSLGLKGNHKVISLFPGRRPEEWQSTMAIFPDLVRELTAENVQIVLVLPDQLSSSQEEDLKKWQQPPHSIVGMNLEVLAVSTVAVTGCGAITVECGILSVPCVPIYGKARDSKLKVHALLNQIAGKPILREFASDEGAKAIATVVESYLHEGKERQQLLAELQKISTELQGFSAERVASFISQQIAPWQQGSSRRSSPKQHES